MVDYYYGRWNEGRVHEVLLYPSSSSGWMPYSVPGTNLWGYPTGTDFLGTPNVIDLNPSGYATPYRGEKILSGGALSRLQIIGMEQTETGYNPGGGSSLASEIYVATESRTEYSPVTQKAADPGFYDDSVSQIAHDKAFNAEDSDGSLSGSMPGYGIGVVHYGLRYRNRDYGILGAAGRHHEKWGVRTGFYTLVSDANFEYAATTNAGSFDGYASIGIAPNKDEWPEGVIRAEVDPEVGVRGREYLEVRVNGWTAPSAQFHGAYKPLNVPGWYPLDNDHPTPQQLLTAYPALPQGGGSVNIPADELTAWRDEGIALGAGGGTWDYSGWAKRYFKIGFTPTPREATITPYEFAMGATFNDPPNPWYDSPDDYLVDVDFIGTSHSPAVGTQGGTGTGLVHELADAEDFKGLYTRRPLDFSIYVKFRTPRWRYVYEIEPSIEGKPDIVRRRFT